VHYTPALGLTALREAIARFYHDRFGADVSPSASSSRRAPRAR
jgi:aspartate/methionine/tyrosine aminotransferase